MGVRGFNGGEFMSLALLKMKPLLDQFVEQVFGFYGAANPDEDLRRFRAKGSTLCVEDLQGFADELRDMDYSEEQAAIVGQARLVWRLAVRRQLPVTWCMRAHSTAKTLFVAICDRSRVPVARVLSGNLEPQDFPRFTSTLGDWVHAPVQVCDASGTGALLEVLPALFSQKDGCHVVCDWPLKGKELAAARQLSKESEIAFIWPEG
jgi:hypothetical protein